MQIPFFHFFCQVSLQHKQTLGNLPTQTKQKRDKWNGFGPFHLIQCIVTMCAQLNDIINAGWNVRWRTRTRLAKFNSNSPVYTFVFVSFYFYVRRERDREKNSEFFFSTVFPFSFVIEILLFFCNGRFDISTWLICFNFDFIIIFRCD